MKYIVSSRLGSHREFWNRPDYLIRPCLSKPKETKTMSFMTIWKHISATAHRSASGRTWSTVVTHELWMAAGTSQSQALLPRGPRLWYQAETVLGMIPCIVNCARENSWCRICQPSPEPVNGRQAYCRHLTKLLSVISKGNNSIQGLIRVCWSMNRAVPPSCDVYTLTG